MVAGVGDGDFSQTGFLGAYLLEIFATSDTPNRLYDALISHSISRDILGQVYKTLIGNAIKLPLHKSMDIFWISAGAAGQGRGRGYTYR